MTKASVPSIEPSTAQKWLDEGALLVDLREKVEREALAFTQAEYLALPLSELEAGYAALPQNRPLIMACQSGSRSLRATAFLIKRGFRAIANLEGGILAWQAQGYPVAVREHAKLATAGDCCSSPNCC